MTNAQIAPVQDRRRAERYAVRLAGKIILPAARATLDCIITNLSAGGAGFWCAEPPSLKTAIMLYVEGFGRFEGVVARRLQGEIGVTFAGSDAKRKRLEKALAVFVREGMKAVTRLRRSERVKAGTPIDHFCLASGEKVPCTVLDISLQGAALRTSRRPPIGEVIHLGKTRSWVVRHHADDSIGVQFLQPTAG
jgi:hypothetical protein